MKSSTLSGFQKGMDGGLTHNIDAGENQEQKQKVHAPHLA